MTPVIDIFSKEEGGAWTRCRNDVFCDNEECQYFQEPELEDEMGRCVCETNTFTVHPDSLIECDMVD